MNYDTFIDTVAQRAGVSSDEAVVYSRATLETLADRLTGGEALDLSAQLPTPLHGPLRPRNETAERFGLDEFVRRVRERAGVDESRARNAVRAVFTTLREAVTGGEFDDIMSQLPQDFNDLVEPATSRGGGGTKQVTRRRG
jgi:uncharacterized protein (DUF2267 family)